MSARSAPPRADTAIAGESTETKRWRRALATIAFAASIALSACEWRSGDTVAGESVPQLLSFGTYDGDSTDLFDEWVVQSRYVTTRDGTRLAVDIARPSRGNTAVEEPLPVLWSYTRYHRRADGAPSIERSPLLQHLVRHGYVIVVANVRGGGASFGRFEGLFSKPETRDAYDLIDWLSKQSWSDGNIGMFGLSYMGITQYMAASTRHPALKAIMPENGYFDFYDALNTGGIHRADMVRHWSDGVRLLDNETPPTPVDEDLDGAMAARAVEAHQDNFDPTSELGQAPFRDSTTPNFRWTQDSPAAVMDAINEAAIPIYHWGAWYDAYTLDTLLMFANFDGPKKLAMGPWAHAPSTAEEREERLRILTAETHRWYDYWLKGVENGVMDDPRIHLALVDVPGEKWSWKSLDALPMPPSNEIVLHLTGAAAPDGIGHGLEPEPDGAVSLDYAVDLGTTTGTSSRWDANFGGTKAYPDMTENDRRALTFTTPPLEESLTVVGSPIVTLFVASTAGDTDFYAVLEEVTEEGHSHYVSEGMLRGSLRKLGKPPWNNLGLPWQRAHAQDVQALTPGELYEIRFDIYPTAHLFNRGHRIRLAILGADRDNTEPPPAPNAVITLQTGGDHASRITLPLASAGTLLAVD